MTQPPTFDPNQQPMPPESAGYVPTYPANVQPSTELNIMSIIGFALAITCGGLGIGSLIVSIIGLAQINKEPQRYHGKGFAVAGIVLSILTILGFMLYLLVLIVAVCINPDDWSISPDPSF